MSRSASVNRPLRKKGKKETSGDKLKAKEEEYMYVKKTVFFWLYFQQGLSDIHVPDLRY